MEYKWVGNHPQDLASGRVLAPGETAELSDEDAALPHNKSLIEDGQLIALGDGEVLNATPDAIELAEANNLDLSTITGTGAAGRVTKRDVEKHIEQEGS